MVVLSRVHYRLVSKIHLLKPLLSGTGALERFCLGKTVPTRLGTADWVGGYFESVGFFHDGIFTLEATSHADCSVDAVNLQRYTALTNAGANA